MNGSKLLIVGVLVGFGGGMAAAIGIKLARGNGKAEATGTEPGATPAAGALAITPFDLSSSAATPTPATLEAPASDDSASAAGSANPARPGSTRKNVAMITKGKTIPDAINDLPVEGPPASMTFGKSGGGGNAIVKIVEERHNDTSLVRVELTGKARYKILQLPKRHELWIDFEETEVPGGEKVSAGSNVHVTEVRARTFEEGAIARVTVRLAQEGKFSVFPSKGTGEADGMLEIMLGP